VFPGHGEVKAAKERHWAMVLDNVPDDCLPYEKSKGKNRLTSWIRKGERAPPI